MSRHHYVQPKLCLVYLNPRDGYPKYVIPQTYCPNRLRLLNLLPVSLRICQRISLPRNLQPHLYHFLNPKKLTRHFQKRHHYKKAH